MGIGAARIFMLNTASLHVALVSPPSPPLLLDSPNPRVILPPPIPLCPTYLALATDSFPDVNDLDDTLNLPDVDKGVNVAKSAHLYHEFFNICEEYDLAGIDFIDEEIQFVSRVGERIRNEGMTILERGMEGMNHDEIGTGLQVFYNLGELKSMVEVIVGRYKAIGANRVGVVQVG